MQVLWSNITSMEELINEHYSNPENMCGSKEKKMELARPHTEKGSRSPLHDSTDLATRKTTRRKTVEKERKDIGQQI